MMERTVPSVILCLGVITVNSFLVHVDASKILLYPLAQGFNSRLMNMEKIAKILVDRGHNVSMLINSDYRPIKLPKQVEIVNFPVAQDVNQIHDTDFINSIIATDDRITLVKIIVKQQLAFCESLLESRVLDKLKNMFDLFFVDYFDQCSRILVDYLDIPTVLYSNFGFSTDLDIFYPSPLSFVTGPFTKLRHVGEMGFWDRVLNTYDYLFGIALLKVFFFSKYQEMRERFGYNASLSVDDSYHKCALMMANANFAFDYPRPLMPRVINIGGVFYEHPKPLTREFLEIMDKSGDAGVIIVSFGSLVKSLNPQKALIFARAFSRLPQRVLWRNVGNPPPGIANNTHIFSWLPQHDLLGHPKMRLFITHCGVSGSHEAVLNGVPVIAVPIMVDQFWHAGKLVDRLQMGKWIDLNNFSEDELYEKISEVLQNKKYKEKAMIASKLMRDSFMDPKEHFIYWIEYVLRHKGAPHLQSDAVARLRWYQYYLLDVLAFLLCIPVIFIIVVILVLKCLCTLKNKQMKQKIH